MDHLISDYYREQNTQLHATKRYGKWGHRQREAVEDVYSRFQCKDALDYGAGQKSLSESVSFALTNYDPAVPEISALPEPHDLLICSDVLEHIEPEYLDNVLEHIQSLTKVVGYFVIATTLDGTKTLPDGRDPHLIVESPDWWVEKIGEYFDVHSWKVGDRREVVMEVVNKSTT